MARLVPVLKNRYDPRAEPERWGYANLQGEIAIDHRFDQADYFHGGVARVKLDDRWTYVDETGAELLKERFDGIADFENGRGLVRRVNKSGYVDRTGALVVQPSYDDGSSFSEGLAAVRVGDKWGYIDDAGHEVIVPRFDDALPFSEGFAAVSLGDRWSFVDRDGKLASEPRFERARSFSEGYAAVKLGKKFGYVDKTCSIALEPQFDLVGDFHEGLASVANRAGPFMTSQLWHFVDTRGRKALPLEVHDSLGPFFSEGLVAARMNRGWGYYDKTGQAKIDKATFVGKDRKSSYVSTITSAAPFRDGVARVYIGPSYYVDPVRLQDPDYMAYIDKAGEVVVGSPR
jgi:hypothetical protein